MRTHSEIIAAGDGKTEGATAFARSIGLEDANPVHQWKRNDNIPSPYWADVVAAGLATYDELGDAAKPKKRVAA